MSLVPLIDDEMARRPKAFGFWAYPAQGRPVRSSELLQELVEQEASRANAMRAQLEAWQKSLTRRLNGEDYTNP